MNLDYVKLFVRIAATNNISLAGKSLGLSPAVSSAHIKKLEESLSVRLIHRTTRQVSLTEDGRSFLLHAVNILEGVETAQASLGSRSFLPKGNLRVTSSAAFGRLHIVPTLKDFMQRYPDLKIDLHLSDTIVDIVEGGFDLAVRDAALNDSSLIARRLASVQRILCASPNYLKEQGIPKTPDDLEKHDCINFMGLETWRFKTPKGPQAIKTRNVLRTDNGEAARDACVQGLGITLSSTWCCYKEVRQGLLLPVLADYPVVSDTSIWAVYPSSHMLAPKVRFFIDHLRRCFGEKPYWDA